jgi:hypothetical protein
MALSQLSVDDLDTLIAMLERYQCAVSGTALSDNGQGDAARPGSRTWRDRAITAHRSRDVCLVGIGPVAAVVAFCAAATTPRSTRVD